MVRYLKDTIAAIVTPPGMGAVSIVRVSGPAAPQIAQDITRTQLTHKAVHVGCFHDAQGEVVDHGVALFFKGPHSFTGEDVLELQGHGGLAVTQALLGLALSAGARMAEPGEFSKRAFLNDRMDLAQAESVADLIQATTAQSARSAVRSLRGVFSERIHALVAQLTEVRVFLEAALDFSDEDIDFLSDGDLAKRLYGVRDAAHTLLMSAQQGALLQRGLSVALVGQPNAGKSSLLNRLCGEDRAIVTNVPGTTRDVLHQSIQVSGVPIQLLDTAGLRDSADHVEQIGVARAKVAMAQADCIVWVVDVASQGWPTHSELLDGLKPAAEEDALRDGVLAKVLVVGNKLDLCEASSPQPEEEAPFDWVACSMKTGEGLEALQHKLLAKMGYDLASQEDQVSARERHVEAIASAHQHIQKACDQVNQHTAECCAEELRLAQQSLQSITGAFTSDDLLGEIFSSFCIGK